MPTRRRSRPLAPVLLVVLAALAAALLPTAAAHAAGPKPAGPDRAIAHGAAARGWSWKLSAQPMRFGTLSGYCMHGSITPPGFPVSTGSGCFFGSLERTKRISPFSSSFSSGDDGQLLVAGAVIGRATRVAISFRDHATVRVRTRRAPKALHTRLRFFAAPVERIATVKAVVAYDRAGQRVARGR